MVIGSIKNILSTCAGLIILGENRPLIFIRKVTIFLAQTGFSFTAPRQCQHKKLYCDNKEWSFYGQRIHFQMFFRNKLLVKNHAMADFRKQHNRN